MKKLLDIVVTDENGEWLSSQEGKIEEKQEVRRKNWTA